MKSIINILCILVACAGVIMLFSEAPEMEPFSAQLGIWAKGIVVILLAVFASKLINKEDTDHGFERKN